MGKRRLGSVAAALALAVGGLAACGSSGGGSGTSATTAAGGSSTTAAQKLGGNVSVWAVWSGDEQASFGKVLDAFKAKSGVSADYQSKGDNLPTVLGTAIAGGAPPDVAVLPQPGLLKDLVAKGALKPLDDVAGPAMKADFASTWSNLGTVDGKLYGVYFKAANKSTVWYDPKRFKDAGITPPATYEDLLAANATLKQFGTAPFAMCGGSGWTLTDWFENVYLRTAGKEKYQQLAQHQIPWTDPSVTAAFQQLAKIFGDPASMVGGTAGSVATPFPDCVSQVFGPSPKAAMVYEGDFVATTIQGLGAEQKPGTSYDFFSFPSIGGSPTSVSGGGDVAVMLRDTPQARALIAFLATPEAATTWARLGGFTSPNKRVDLSAYPDDITRKSAKALIDAGDSVVFDMSDQAPAAFGGTAGSGEWADLQAWAKNPSDISGTQAKLEADAKAAYGR